MKFVLGKMPESDEFDLWCDGWTPLREYGLIKSQLYALPLLLLMILLTYIFYEINHININNSFTIFVLLFVIIIPIHELIHGFFLPKSLLSNSVYFGFHLKTLAFYVHYEGSMTRNRFLLVLTAPLIVLSIIPMILIILIGLNHNIIAIAAKLTLLNTLLSSIDILGALKIIKQVPKNADVRNKGFKTYWTKSNNTD